MQQLQNLQKQWRDSARFRGVHASMCLGKDGVVLGAKTVLAKRDNDGALVLEGEDAKVLTLLSVAYGRPIRASVLNKLRRASKLAQAGDECKAAMEVALALPVLADAGDAARRLFIAEGLIAEGIEPRDIWTALEFDAAPLDALEKYDPNEPRNPKGDGNASGEWINWDDASIVPAQGFNDATLAVRDKYDRHVLAYRNETQFRPGEEYQAAAAVSSGKGDRGGGVSYGAFQFASKPGTPYELLRTEGAPWTSQFKVHDATKQFGNFANTWRAVAAKYPDAFYQAQIAFAERQYYAPVAAQVLRETGFDINLMSDAVQNAAMSMGLNNTHHAAKIIVSAMSILSLQGLAPSSDGYDAALIDNIYAARTSDALQNAPRKERRGLITRYTRERAEAQLMRQGLL